MVEKAVGQERGTVPCQQLAEKWGRGRVLVIQPQGNGFSSNWNELEEASAGGCSQLTPQFQPREAQTEDQAGTNQTPGP